MNVPDVTIYRRLLRDIAIYITNLIDIFGLNHPRSCRDEIGFTQSTKNQTSAIHVGMHQYHTLGFWY